MMQRIGDHLEYLAKYATGIAFQDSEDVQKVRLMYCFINELIIKIFYRP